MQPSPPVTQTNKPGTQHRRLTRVLKTQSLHVKSPHQTLPKSSDLVLTNTQPGYKPQDGKCGDIPAPPKPEIRTIREKPSHPTRLPPNLSQPFPFCPFTIPLSPAYPPCEKGAPIDRPSVVTNKHARGRGGWIPVPRRLNELTVGCPYPGFHPPGVTNGNSGVENNTTTASGDLFGNFWHGHQ